MVLPGVQVAALIMAPIRLAILLCDTPAPPVLKEDGDYHKIFDVWLRGVSPSVDFTLDAFDVVNKMEYPPENAKYDGVLLTGSGQLNYLPATSAFPSDAFSQPPLHSRTSNGSIGWWNIPPSLRDRSQTSSSSVHPTVNLSARQTFADSPSQVSVSVTRSSEGR